MDLAKRIHSARRILVVGVDLAASLAWFLAYGLTPLGFDARRRLEARAILQHKIDLMTEKDLLVAISFGRCLRETVEAVERAHGRGVPTFGITDSDTTPIALHCDRLSRGVNQQSVVHRFVRRADGAAEYDHRCLRPPATEARARDVEPHRTGIPHRTPLVPGAKEKILGHKSTNVFGAVGSNSFVLFVPFMGKI